MLEVFRDWFRIIFSLKHEETCWIFSLETPVCALIRMIRPSRAISEERILFVGRWIPLSRASLAALIGSLENDQTDGRQRCLKADSVLFLGIYRKEWPLDMKDDEYQNWCVVVQGDSNLIEIWGSAEFVKAMSRFLSIFFSSKIKINKR